jgi:DUF4097 and DUF4098 domain-containing protein YvlB
MTPWLVAVLSTLTLGNQADTTLTVRQGARLEVSNFSGQVAVSAWSRDAVRVRVRCEDNTEVEVEPNAGGIQIDSSARRGPPGWVEYQISAPAWMPIEISGTTNDVEIDGSKASVKVETVNGGITLRGGEGNIELSSVEGDVAVTGAKGRLKLNAISQGVTASHLAGQADIETVNGDILLDDVQLDALDASSVSGNVWLNGTLKDQGRYQLQSHDGDIQVVMPDQPNARVTVSTYSGELSSDFAVGVNHLNSRENVGFTLGNGGPRLDLNSFSGRIQLLKASSVDATRRSLKSGRPAGKPPKEPKSKQKSDDSDE